MKMQGIILGLFLVVLIPSVLAITPSTYSNYDYEHVTSEYSAYFRNNTNTGYPIRIERGGYYFIYDISGSNLQYRGKPGQPAVTDTLGGGASSNTLETKLRYAGDSIYYDDAFSYTNMTYNLLPSEIKELFTLLQIPNLKTEYDYLEYTGHVYFNKSLKICANNQCYTPSGSQDNFNTSGRIYFKDTSDETQFSLKEPIIYDSAGHTTTGTYFVYGSDAQMRFDLRIPVSWLATASYPVYIDPTYDVYDSSINDTLWLYETCGGGACSPICGETATYIYAQSCFDGGGSYRTGYIQTRYNLTHPFYLKTSIYMWGSDTNNGDGDGSSYFFVGSKQIFGCPGGQVCGVNWCGSCSATLDVVAPARNLSSVTFTMTGTITGATNTTSPQVITVDLSSGQNYLYMIGYNGYHGASGGGRFYDINYTYYPNITTAALSSPNNQTISNLIGTCAADDFNGLTMTYYYSLYRNGVLNQTGVYTSMASGQSKTVVNLTALTFSAGNYSLECTAGNNDPATIPLNSTTVNSGVLFVDASFPYFNESLPDITIPHHQDLTLKVNCSDPLGETIIYYDNTSLFDINSSTGLINHNPTIGEVGAYSIKITCGDGSFNVSDDFVYTITNTAPSFNPSLIYHSVHHGTNLIYDVNCTDANSDTIIYYDNTSLFDIDSSTGIINDTATIFEVGNYSILLTCGDGYLNTTQSFNYAVINDVPTIISFLFTPLSNDGTFDVTANYTTSDTENDTVYSWSEWWLNNIYMPAWDNLFTIGEGNFTNGDTLKIRLLIGDLGINASKVNYTLTINDSVAPSMNVSVSSSAIVLNAQGYLLGNCVDIASSISNVKFYLKDPDLLTTMYTVGTAYNGSLYRQAVTFNKLGTWILTNASCEDTAGNVFLNSSVGISIVVSSTPVVNETPGGGGGGQRQTIIVGTNATAELLGITCGNSICDKNENPGNCFQDCPINIDTLLSGQTFGQFWFAQALVVFIIGIIGYFMWKSAKKK